MHHAAGALAALAIEDEGGKTDLNTAPPRLMSALLRGFWCGIAGSRSHCRGDH